MIFMRMDSSVLIAYALPWQDLEIATICEHCGSATVATVDLMQEMNEIFTYCVLLQYKTSEKVHIN